MYILNKTPNKKHVCLSVCLSALLADESSHDFLRNPPDSFNVRSMLETMKVSEPLSEYARNKNAVIDEQLEKNETIDVLGKVLWCRACHITQHENPDLRRLKGNVNLRKVTLQALRQLYVKLFILLPKASINEIDSSLRCRSFSFNISVSAQ